ncbi:MAG: hypothetical protein DBX91_13315 [Subdoligranulum variabile]|nr:MAG: hypothetical protein DBX91_13315 [Subdoligranulum variabile]
MISLTDKACCPAMEEVAAYIRNPLFRQFCGDMKEAFGCAPRMEYSACSWERGWNLKFKKGGKNLCTLYPRENYFTVLVVVGAKEKPAAEALLPACTPELRAIYSAAKEGNGQRWLMIDLEDRDALYADVLRLIRLRRG